MEWQPSEIIENTAAKRNAYYISVITHPLLMPVAGFLLLNKYNATVFQGQSLYILLLVFTITVVGLPAYFMFSLKRSGYIQSYDMETLQERRLPLVFSSGVMLFNYFLMQRSGIPSPFPAYFLSISITALLAMFISFFYKISLHTIGIGFIFGLGLMLATFSSSDLRWYLIIVSLITGIIATSRLYLQAHTPAQIYLGFLVGVISPGTMYLFL